MIELRLNHDVITPEFTRHQKNSGDTPLFFIAQDMDNEPTQKTLFAIMRDAIERSSHAKFPVMLKDVIDYLKVSKPYIERHLEYCYLEKVDFGVQFETGDIFLSARTLAHLCAKHRQCWPAGMDAARLYCISEGITVEKLLPLSATAD